MPNSEIQDHFQQLNGHGPKQLTSPKEHINGITAPDNQHSPTTQSPDQDRPEGSAGQTAGRPTTPELPNGNRLCTPRRLAAKLPSSGEAAGPPTPMQPPTATRRSETSPPGRSDEEHPQLEVAPVETVASPQRDARKEQQRPAPGNRAPASARQPPAARYLNFHHQGPPNGRARSGGRTSPQRNMQRMHDAIHSPQTTEDEEEWHVDPEMNRDMEDWLWQQGPQEHTQYYNHGQNYSQEFGHHQDMAWSGNSATHMPPHHTNRPQPPRQPYPGGPPTPMAFHQGQTPPAGVVLGYPAMHPGAHYTQEGQQFMMGFPPKVQGWVSVPAVSVHNPMHPREHYGPLPHGARYPQSMPTQVVPEDAQYNAMWAEQQRRVQLAMMEQAAYAHGAQQMAFPHPAMVPVNVPMQQFSGGQDSEYGGSHHAQQRSSGSGHRAPANPAPIGMGKFIAPAKASMSGAAARQQGAFPGRRGHRRTQSSRAASMRSGSSHSGHQSPARPPPADPPSQPPALTLQDVLKDLVKMCDNQDGSRQVQALLTSATAQEISAFVAGFVEHSQAMEVVTDSFGNYVAQRLIEAAAAEARLALGRLLAPAMLELSKHQYGCRVVQNAIQSLPSIEAKVQMATKLKGQVVACVLNSHGNHVVQCCITNIPHAENGHSIKFMLEELRDATLKLSPEALSDKDRAAAATGEHEEAGFVGVAKHSYGCRVVQRVMEHCVLPGWKDQICHQVAEHACELAQTSFGNYVIQSCLALCSDEDRATAYTNLMTQVGALAFHKNASNVYEKLIGAADGRRMTAAQLDAFYGRLLADSGNRAEPGPLLDRLIPHQYGNYIVSSAVMLLSKEQLATVKARIEAEQRAVEANPKSTKQVKDRVNKLLGRVSAYLEQAASEAAAGDL